ncbi:hypothetical protein GCM10027416_19740 [Okibacterium endophyticum]
MPAMLFALLAAVSLAVLGAQPASAVSLNSVTPDSGLSSTDTVNASVTFVTGEAFFALAECNVDYDPGTACNADTAIGLVPVPGTGTFVFDLDVASSFDNSSFIPGESGPGGTTDCLPALGGSQCAVYVSTYSSTGTHLDDKLINISF